MSELKPCPFCGKFPESQITIIGKDSIWCGNSSCRMNSGTYYTPDEWNARPIEDALRDEIVALKSNLKVHNDTEIVMAEERDALQAEVADLRYKNSVLKDYEELYHRRGDINGSLVRERNGMEYERDALQAKLEKVINMIHAIYKTRELSEVDYCSMDNAIDDAEEYCKQLEAE